MDLISFQVIIMKLIW